MRFVVAGLLLAHGLLHVLGFLKAWHLAALPQLTGKTLVPLATATTHLVGIAWLVVAAVLVVAALLRLFDHGAWWMVGAQRSSVRSC